MILEYLTGRLVDEACSAIEGEHVERFNRHALLKAQAKEYVRQTQARLIVQPVVERLTRLGRPGWGGGAAAAAAGELAGANAAPAGLCRR